MSAGLRRFILFHGRRHPSEMGAAEVSAFLSNLATVGKVSASTQNQALAALLFLYADVLGHKLEALEEMVHAKRPARLPVVMTRQEVAMVLSKLSGSSRLMASVLYGAGLRLSECASLRVKDVDFSLSQLVVRSGKGQRDRLALLPKSLVGPLQVQLQKVCEQRAMRRAVMAAGVNKPASCHTLPLLCLAPVGGWLRYSYDSEAARSSRFTNRDDLRSCAESRPARCAEILSISSTWTCQFVHREAKSDGEARRDAEEVPRLYVF